MLRQPVDRFPMAPTRSRAPRRAFLFLMALLSLPAGAARAGDDSAAEAPPPPPQVKATQIVTDELLGPPGSAQVAPVLEGVDLEGRDVDLAAILPGGPVLVSFWALWCKPCLKELPELDRVVLDYAKRGVSMIAVNADAPGDAAKVRPFVKSRGFHFRVVPDAGGEIRRDFGVNTLPTTLLLAPDGSTLWTNQGYRPGDEKGLRAALDAWFAAQSPK